MRSLPTAAPERLDVLMIVGDEDETITGDLEKAKTRLDQIGLPYTVEVIAGDDGALDTLSNGGLLSIMTSRLLNK